MNERDRTPDPGISAEAVETLLWLAKSESLDRRRFQVMERLRSVRATGEFATLPEELREKVREVLADSER
jgi:hypothetical protein